MLPYNLILESIVSILRNDLLINGLRKISLLLLLFPEFVLLGGVRGLQLFDFIALYKFEGVIQIAEVVSQIVGLIVEEIGCFLGCFGLGRWFFSHLFLNQLIMGRCQILFEFITMSEQHFYLNSNLFCKPSLSLKTQSDSRVKAASYIFIILPSFQIFKEAPFNHPKLTCPKSSTKQQKNHPKLLQFKPAPNLQYSNLIITAKFKMNILQKAMLRRQANIFKLRYAFANFKLHAKTNELQEKHFSFRQQSDVKPERPQDIELENKELYLKYMEEVLERKEKELMEFEDYLLKHKKQQDQEQVKRSILNPLALTQLAQTLNKKVEVFKDIIDKYSINSKNHAQLEKLAQSLEVVEQTCRQNYNQLKETLLQNHQQLILQKEQLSAKLSKLHELQSYQKYLNQLQAALQQKQYQIIRKQSQMKSGGTVSQNLSAIPVSSPAYNTFHEQEDHSSHSEISMRKRTKIFQHRSSNKTTQISAHNKSSKIMQERSTEEVLLQSPQQASCNHSTLKTQVAMVSQSTQSTMEDPLLSNILRVNNQARLLKILKLWFKYSANNSKTASNQHRSLMYLYHWRLNSLFDQKIKDSVAEMVRWPRCLQPFADLPPLNYAELSLKKKKYLQNFFDFERRLFQRKKIKTQLMSIIKNKNRRERTAFFLYFKKFREISKILAIIQQGPNWQGQPLKQINLQQSQVNPNNSATTKQFKQSRIVSSSGILLSEDKSKHTIPKTRSNKSNTQTSQAKLKGRQASVDLVKFKQYIKSQEQNQAKLAIECIRTQAVFRIASVLTISTNRLSSKLFSRVSRQSDANRINNLQKAINGYDFKWQLFMAKIRVALTSNTNKIGHLEQLVAFIGNDK